MEILISGGNSTLGTALQPVLKSFANVTTAGRKNCDVLLDLKAPAGSMILPEGTDTIIHTAAHFGGNDGTSIIEAEDINVTGTLKLCEAGVRAGIKRFVFISTAFAGLPPGDSSYNIYSASKRHAEEALTIFCNTVSLPLTILRPSQIYGNGDQFRRHQPFFYSMIDKAQMGQDIVLYGSHDPVRNYIHMNDVTQIISTTIQKGVNGTFNCASLSTITYSQIANAAYQAFATRGNIIFLREKPDIPDKIVETDDLLYKKIDRFPAISIDEGIQMIANFRRTQK